LKLGPSHRLRRSIHIAYSNVLFKLGLTESIVSNKITARREENRKAKKIDSESDKDLC